MCSASARRSSARRSRGSWSRRSSPRASTAGSATWLGWRRWQRWRGRCMAKSRLQKLAERGQSIWIDNLSRQLVHGGGLQELIDESSVTGVTSNPTIFQKAIAQSDDYDDQLRACLETMDDPREIFFRLAEDDVRDACDVLLPVWERTRGVDGYVSIEVDPWLAYDHVENAFSGSRWEFLEGKGASKQRPLWASTSTKNPAYRDVMYVEELIGPDTVDTMPPETLEAFADHGEVRGDTVREGVAEAERLLEELGAAGVDYDEVVETLEDEGVRKFTDSFDELIDGIRAKRGELAAA